MNKNLRIVNSRSAYSILSDHEQSAREDIEKTTDLSLRNEIRKSAIMSITSQIKLKEIQLREAELLLKNNDADLLYKNPELKDYDYLSMLPSKIEDEY